MFTRAAKAQADLLGDLVSLEQKKPLHNPQPQHTWTQSQISNLQITSPSQGQWPEGFLNVHLENGATFSRAISM